MMTDIKIKPVTSEVRELLKGHCRGHKSPMYAAIDKFMESTADMVEVDFKDKLLKLDSFRANLYTRYPKQLSIRAVGGHVILIKRQSHDKP